MNIKISPKFIELVRSNGKRLICGIITCVALAIPHTGFAEETEKDYNTPTKMVDTLNNYNTEEVEFIVDGESVKVTLDLNNPELSKEEIKEILSTLNVTHDMPEYPSFFLVTHWEKSEDYDKVKKESNDDREYKRTIYCFRANEEYGTIHFDNDIEKITKSFRDEDNEEERNKYFDLIGSKEEYVIVNKEEEKELETEKDLIMFEGSNIAFKIKKQEKGRSNAGSLAIILMNSFNMARILSKKRDD